MDNLMQYLSDFLAAGVIPFVVEWLKKLNLPVKVAPLVAVALAAAYVYVAKLLGFGASFDSALDYLIKALGIGAVSVFGYDLVKSVTK